MTCSMIKHSKSPNAPHLPPFNNDVRMMAQRLSYDLLAVITTSLPIIYRKS